MSQQFPTQCYLDTMVRFLDTIEYHDLNYTHAVRVENLHYTYSKAAAHFAQPLQQETIKISPKKLQASLQSIVAMVVYSWVKVSKEVMADLSIHYTYMLILDDSTDDPDATMKTFTTDLLEGRPQQHYWWRLVNAQFPSLVRHYGPFCSLNLMRSTLDFFQGCWIEQYNFLGYPGSYDYPTFLRRLNGLGHCVGASMFPKAQFDEEATFREITSVISQMENWMVFVNDLMSFYKEFDEPRDQTSLVNSYVQCERITLDDALKKLTHDTIVCSEQLMAVFKDRDQKVAETLFSFCQGYVTWHLCDARYRLSELCEDAGTYPAGAPFRAYQQAGRQVGGVNPTDWAFPSIAMLAESQKEQQVQQQQQLQPHHEGKVLLSSTTRQNKEWLLYPDQHLRIILRSVFGFLWRHWLNLGR